ncbi:FAD-binding protein [uncultured Amnibacterium sp.]|uniref:FAD-binding protein n=1 Tax=uncultured Amnibacterium sp. TaxID=1631851 RepID=UPI0035CB493A
MTATDVDIIIAGFGIAGASAAIAAHDAGARVLVVEKTSAGGGNCRWSGGFLYAIDGPTATDHLDAACYGKTERSVLEAYASGTREIPAWIESLGGKVRSLPTAIFSCPWPHFPGGGDDCIYRQIDSGQLPPGPAFWDLMASAVERRDIEVVYDTAVVDLLVGGGAVFGAVVEAKGVRRSITAAAVILASGGIEHDPYLRETYLTLPVKPIGHPGNTGDAVRLAQKVGGALWHMAAHFGWLAYARPEFPSAFGIDLMHGTSYLVVDEDGRRFSDETGRGGAHDFARFFPGQASRPRSRAFFVFDETARLSGSLNGIGGSPNDYRWSSDNSAEIEAGWITKADTAHELAAAIGIDADALASTLAEFAEAAAIGADWRFDRPAETIAALESPFYALEVVPGLATASGGPRRDARARIVRPGGEPIPGLYGVGGAGSIWGGQVTEQGGGLTDAIVFGRIAGADASRIALADEQLQGA